MTFFVSGITSMTMKLNKQDFASSQSLYHCSREVVRATFGEDENAALNYYQAMVSFVTGVVPCGEVGSRKLLDVGCGAGWSTAVFGVAGYDALGVDLNANAFEATASDRVKLQYGSALDLPFSDNRLMWL